MKAVTRLQSISPLTCFLLSGSVLEILYLLICTLIPFNTTSTTHWSSNTAWPWYMLWTLWIIALRRFDALTISVILLSCTALLTYLLLYVDNLPIAFYQPLLIFGIPLIYLITRLKRSNERITLFYERRSETAKN